MCNMKWVYWDTHFLKKVIDPSEITEWNPGEELLFRSLHGREVVWLETVTRVLGKETAGARCPR